MDRALATQNRVDLDVRYRYPARSEGVRMPFGRVRKVEKVIGVGSLAKFLAVTYNQLAEMLAKLVGHRYGKSSMSTWAMVETYKRLPKAWYKKYWMPHHIEQAFKKLIRDYIHWATDGRYAVRVTGIHRWRVTLRRI
jgi:DNA-binding transcriptional regulator PaaX